MFFEAPANRFWEQSGGWGRRMDIFPIQVYNRFKEVFPVWNTLKRDQTFEFFSLRYWDVVWTGTPSPLPHTGLPFANPARGKAIHEGGWSFRNCTYHRNWWKMENPILGSGFSASSNSEELAILRTKLNPRFALNSLRREVMIKLHGASFYALFPKCLIELIEKFRPVR